MTTVTIEVTVVTKETTWITIQWIELGGTVA